MYRETTQIGELIKAHNEQTNNIVEIYEEMLAKKDEEISKLKQENYDLKSKKEVSDELLKRNNKIANSFKRKAKKK